MLNQNILRIVGIAFLVIGAIFLIISFAGITGYAVFSEGDFKAGVLTALWFFVAGAVLIGVSVSRLEVKVYDSSSGSGRGKHPDKDYKFDDIRRELNSSGGPVSLGEFKREIDRYRGEEGGEELIEIVRQTYAPVFRAAVNSGDAERARVGRAFLEVLGEKVEEEKEDYRLSSEEREHIKRVFKGFNGTLNSQQRELIKEYGFHYDNTTGGHPMLVHRSGNKMPLPFTPSRQKVGLYVASNMIHLLEEANKKKK